MNRKYAQEILKAYGNLVFQLPNCKKWFQFARQTKDNIDEIEKMTDTKLIESWKGLVLVNYIYQCVSRNDLQRLELIELEIVERPNIDFDKLIQWREEQIAKEERLQLVADYGQNQ